MNTRIFQVQSIEGEPNSRNQPKKKQPFCFWSKYSKRLFWGKTEAHLIVPRISVLHIGQL